MPVKFNCAPGSCNPDLVLGPDLAANLEQLANSGYDLPKFLQDLPEKAKGAAAIEKTTAASHNGIRYHSIATKKLSRNLSKSGSTTLKPVVSWLRDPENTPNKTVCIVAKQQDLAPIAKEIAAGFPKFSLKTRQQAHLGDGLELNFHFVSTDDGNASDKNKLMTLMDNVREAARMTDMPPNLLNTKTFEEEARKVVADLNDARCTIEVLQHDELKKRGMGLIHSVGQASEPGHNSRLAILKWQPQGASKNVALCGKGIIYDTGGLSIKGKTAMPNMKIDCGGACGLLFAFKNLIQNGFKENLFCLLCLAENSVSSNATRPDDVITAYSGLTVEINNTDAEGRLVLADGVHYATKDLKADICLNMCTLTGAQGITTGKVHSSILTNTQDYEQKLVQAGLKSGDHCFPILYAPELLMKEFDSTVADMKNSVQGRSNAQCSCAGHFIEQHLLDGVDYKGVWVHVDMASPVQSPYDGILRTTGYGVSLLAELFKDFC